MKKKWLFGKNNVSRKYPYRTSNYTHWYGTGAGYDHAIVGHDCYSLLTNGSFMTLQEMDEFWKQFEKDYYNERID